MIDGAGKWTKWKGKCCPTLVQVQVKRAVAGIEHELEEIGKRLSTRVLTTMRNGYVMRLIPPGVGLLTVWSVAGWDQSFALDLWIRLISLWTLQCCCVSSLRRKGDIWTRFSISLQTCLKWYNNWLSMVFDKTEPSLTWFRLCNWNRFYSGVCNAAVLPDAPDVRSNWYWWITMLTQTMWVGVIQVESNRGSDLWIGSRDMAANVAVEMVVKITTEGNDIHRGRMWRAHAFGFVDC